MIKYRFSIIVEKDSDGYFAFCPDLQGCYTQGISYEQTLINIKDAIKLHIEELIETGEDIPQAESIMLTTMEVAL